jgi:hypothetical protein
LAHFFLPSARTRERPGIPSMWLFSFIISILIDVTPWLSHTREPRRRPSRQLLRFPQMGNYGMPRKSVTCLSVGLGLRFWTVYASALRVVGPYCTARMHAPYHQVYRTRIYSLCFLLPSINLHFFWDCWVRGESRLRGLHARLGPMDDPCDDFFCRHASKYCSLLESWDFYQLV